MNTNLAIACAQALIGVLLACGIWLGLPARWLPVDFFGTALALGALSAASILFAPKRPAFALRWARIVIWAELAVGTLTVTLLAASMAQLAGSYGPVGAGGAVLMGAIFTLVLPYLVALPALQLHWLRDRSES